MDLEDNSLDNAMSMAVQWNYTQHVNLEDLKMDSNFMWLLVSLICSVCWVVYITYYNSRLIGYFVTRLINKFYFQDDNFKIGSVTVNALSGKVMFRDLVYINYDYTVRVQDGYLIFRWWRRYIPKDVSEDLSHSDTRLSVMLNGVELHVYNRCKLYSDLEKTFGLDSSIFADKNTDDTDANNKELAMNLANERVSSSERNKVRPEAVMARTWRDLIPVIKLDVCSGRVVFGNRLVPTSLSISVEEAHLVYSTKPPASKLDYLMHFVKAKGDNCRVMLVPSPNYTGMVDDPPRYMGEGFVVMSTNYTELYFYMDEPGLVPDEPVLLQLANGDVVESAPPIWGIDIKCGKGTDFSYGPWADRQRDNLFKFFYPADYQNLNVTPQPKPGDRRQTQSFDIRLSTLNEATIDILFSKNKETNAVHINIGAGSYLEVNLPWIVLQDGYTTKITGQLLHLEATTSLQYRSLAESETLEFAVKCHYPLIWNQHQDWSTSFTGCKATVNLIFDHKNFFQDLINDWSSKTRPDILHFIPYTWKISLLLKDFELITLSNQYNWIDCSSMNQENSHVAFCGDLFDLSFDLPFDDFLPSIVPLKIWIQGEGVDMCLYLPEINTSRVILQAIEKNMTFHSCKPLPKNSKWRKTCLPNTGWINCWSVPIVALSIKYDYHPIPPMGPDPQADITTPEKEEILLSPMRISRSKKQPQVQWNHEGKNKFDPSTMTTDKVSVELEVGPSTLLLYGSIIRNFINLKENIFGEDQTFTDMQKSVSRDGSHLHEHIIKMNDKQFSNNTVVTPVSGEDSSDNIKAPFDPRLYRPLEVTVSVTIHDIQSYLVKNCSDNDLSCPLILIERFGFEMKKGYKETKLQLLVSPSVLIISDTTSATNVSSFQPHLSQGHLMLSSLQLRGHAMFSDENTSLDDETIEYAWLIEIQLGQLTGRLTVSQLFNTISSLETFVLLATDVENNLSPPKIGKICHHGCNVMTCTNTDLKSKYHCPSSEDIKYRMTRLAIDLIDIYIVENGTALQTWLSPIRLTICNLHNENFDLGVTGLLPHMKFTQFTQTNLTVSIQNKNGGCNGNQKHKSLESDSWLEVGSTSLGPVLLEAATSISTADVGIQQKFLKLHDEKTKRLWFLWRKDEGGNKTNQCGCLGGCAFFGSNRNGPNFLKPSHKDIQENINVAIFNIQDNKSGEYGYGQSLLHEGHLVFHTPPYSSLEVCLQASPLLSVSSPSPQSISQPHPIGSHHTNSLTRRFSYTSVYKGANNPSNSVKAEVPYARLVDSEGIANQKLDSDSKLNKTILTVPQMESSMSDSKLALNYFNKQDLQGQQYSMAKQMLHNNKESIGYQKKMVNISESHYSLNSNMGDDDSREVHRTVSMNSGNQSEVFFSAEDEISTSRSSSLKQSRNNKSSHISRGQSESTSSDQYCNQKYSSSSLADPFTSSKTNKSPMQLDGTLHNDSDDSHSFSSTSFISALSSQEDMTFINLHVQANKPICDSPLLMASYVCHLSHNKCRNWNHCSVPIGSLPIATTVPLFKCVEHGKLVYCGGKYLPLFEKKNSDIKGFRLASRQEASQPSDSISFNSIVNSHFNVQGRIHPYSQTWWEILKGTNDDHEANTDKLNEEGQLNVSKDQTSLMVKFRGNVDIMITPLLLESVQRFIETLTPVMSNLHPVTILNHLHFSCARSVEAANILKQEHNIANWVEHTKSKKDKTKGDKFSGYGQPNIYEENISRELSVNVIIPKVNVISLQSSIIEDIISFSALDNIQDLTCASIFAVCLENINIKYINSKQMLEVLQIFHRPPARTINHKKTLGIILKPPKAHNDKLLNRQAKEDAVYIETSQKHSEDINVVLDIGKAHTQLRRLHNGGPIIKDAVITGIPAHHSKVSFKCVKLSENHKSEDSHDKTHEPRSKKESESYFSEDVGFIMFESGLEGISIKFTKHSYYDKMDPSDDKLTYKTDSDTCYAESLKSEEYKIEKTARVVRSSMIDEIFKKKEVNTSKPSTPNLGSGHPETPHEPDAPTVTGQTDHSSGAMVQCKDTEKASSCVIDLKTVWFNFAAPPRTPISKKIDFSRLDWNLLTTASPAINAWMNPCNRLGIKVVALYRAYYRRVTATCASLMASSLDLPHIHMPIKSRYSCQTHMAQALREDPSLQLCGVLVHYILQADVAAIQADLSEKHLPSLSTLRRGVIVLTRQWKNTLYTPLLLEHNYKTKMMKPLNVTFTLPDVVENEYEDLLECEDGEVMDENSTLLNTDVPDNTCKLEIPGNTANASTSHQDPSFAPTTSPTVTRGVPHPSVSRPNAVFNSLPFSVRPSHLKDTTLLGYDTLKDDPMLIGSNPSIYSNESIEKFKDETKPKEDLYNWMVKQYPNAKLPGGKHQVDKPQTYGNTPAVNTIPTTAHHAPHTVHHTQPFQYTIQDSLMLLDAHLIFKPMLSALGLASHQVTQGAQTISSLDSLGSNLSLVALMDTFRIDIVVSEFGKSEKGKSGKSSGKGKNVTIETSSEMPSFLCEKVGLDIDVKKVTDITVDDLMQRQNVLYISRGQLKKHINTKINFSLSVRYISQQVNMPLLRLLHQISTMYQNVKDTQSELKGHTKTPKQGKRRYSGTETQCRESESITQKFDASTSTAPLSGQSITFQPTQNVQAVPVLVKTQVHQPIGRSRPQSFAQKLRSTGKTVKGKLGYSFLNEGAHTPMFAETGTPLHASVLESSISSTVPDLGKDDLSTLPINPQGKLTPQCWRTLYYLLDIYADMPETKTVAHRLSVPGEAPETYKINKPSTPRLQSREVLANNSGLRIAIIGVVRIQRTKLLASLSGLKLEAEMTSLQVSLTASKISQWSLAGHLGRTMIVLLEGGLPNQQTVVRVTVGKSQALYSSDSNRKEHNNSGLLSIGAIRVDLPQHPVALHSMMTRSSRQLSSTLQELGVTRTSSRTSRQPAEDNITESPERPSPPPQRPIPPIHTEVFKEKSRFNLIQPLIMQFSIALQSFSLTAALLPSLQAQYKMDNVHSTGVTGSKAHFTIDLPQHSLSFVTKLQATEANLPSAASISLPAVHVSAEYISESSGLPGSVRGSQHHTHGTDSPMEGVILRSGSYLSATADIGTFEHSLSTDLLNHLVFVQKVFMKEVNEVVQKVYGGEKPVPLWSDDEVMAPLTNRLLFSLIIRLKRIQLTATTPSNSAVRLETGLMEFQISNRFENVLQPSTQNSRKIFAKAQVDINLSLGQLIKNAMFEEAEPEFQEYAFFNTRISLRNAFQDEMVSGDDKEVVLITLKRPLIYVQPMAIDRAILVWLNYKNAYEYWNEKRSNLNKEVLKATMQVFEKVQFSSQLSQLPHLSTLFLQLTVDDMGICLPLNQLPVQGNWGQRSTCDLDSRGAVVVTLENTSISACSSGSLVSKGRFVGLCLRFAEDFETSLDDWKPDRNDLSIMNLCSVSEGTYEVCSRTIAAKQNNENAKWFLNVSWQMEGVDIHLDVNVGKQLSALGHTLTMLTGSEEEDPLKMDYDSDDFDDTVVSRDSQDSMVQRSSKKWSDNLPDFLFDSTIDPKKRSKLIEKEMIEQAKIIKDLQTLGASYGTIEQEMKKLHELEALFFKDFRRDVIQKLRRQSVKASSITKGKLGLGSNRSRSFVVPSPTPEDQTDVESCDSTIVASLSSLKGERGSEETLIPKETGHPIPIPHDNLFEERSWSSVENSPHPGPSRSASLRERNESGRRIVTFNPTIARQSSLPTGGIGYAIPDQDNELDDSWGSHMDVQGESVQLRRKTVHSIPALDSSTAPNKKTQEPNIDFELDVKVFINSGKCVLHTKDPTKEEDSKIGPKIRKERSASGGLTELAMGAKDHSATVGGPPSSPSTSRKHKKHSHSQHSSHTSHHSQPHLTRNHYPLIDLTTFHVPGLDVKVQYESKTVQDDIASPQGALKSSQSQLRKGGVKKASLFAWVTLQSIPEETIISPHILEFLEQTLEPIPTKASLSSATESMNTMFDMENDDGGVSASYGQYVYASFPVDVIVYFHMQPSTFRFSCLPVSRVECMLQLPSLGIVFSSKRAQEDEINHPSVAVGGLSVTGCLADFSVYIFHPYGGKKPGIKEAQWSPLSDSERKDSLSMNVEFVKFHLSRSRKVDFQGDPDQSTAVVRFSTIIDIGSASFKYDMRRLTEILAFPKAWYRRTIVRRLFLGDVSLSAPSEADTSTQQHSPASPMATSKDKSKPSVMRSKLRDNGRNSSLETAQSNSTDTPAAAWETLVLFAFNFTKLNVHMNMGNVMGNVTWLSRDFHSMGRLNIGSTGNRNMCVGVGLGSSSLDAKGGIVGGIISLSTIDTFVHIIEEPGSNPSHHCGLSLNALELRLDYMGTSMLMARVSSLKVELKDEWMAHIAQTHPHHGCTNRPAIILVHGTLNWQQLQLLISRSTTPDLFKMQLKLEEFFTQQFKSSKRVFSNLYTSYSNTNSLPSKSSKQRKEGEEGRQHQHWQKVLSLISGLQLSTLPSPLPTNGTVLGGTMELQGAHISLGCFHGINFKSKSWALFSLRDTFISFTTEAQQVPTEDGNVEVHIVQSLTASLGASTGTAVQHESMATVCRMSRNIIFPPQFKTLREWFHYAFFNSDIDAVECFPSLERDAGSLDRERDRERPPRSGSSTNSKLVDPHHTREVIFALPSLQLHFKTQHLKQTSFPNNPDNKTVVECHFITEFEDHIFVTVDAEAFFFLHALISSYVRERTPSSSSGSNVGRSQSPDINQSSSHSESSFKQNEDIPMTHSMKKSGESGSIDKTPVKINVYDKDWREYQCNTWHLEPTVRLLSWAGKSIEPYGVDYILQKLGFRHARTTIPKWLQRGTLDPLDKLLALILLQLVGIIPQKQN